MENKSWTIVALAACVLACTAQTAEELPVLKHQATEVLYKPRQPFILNCSVTGGEGRDVKYTWQKDSKPLDLQANPAIIQRKNEGSLVFLDPKKGTENGQYQCFAESEFGVATSRPISVHETYITYKTESYSHKPFEGKPLKMTCKKPESYPETKIYWEYQAISDPSIAQSITALDRRTTEGSDGNLYITSVESGDKSQGFRFVCLGRTPAVASPVTLALHHIEDTIGPNNSLQPEPLFLTQDLVAKAGDVTMIYCIYAQNPYSYVRWTFEGKEFNHTNHMTSRNRSAGKRLIIRDTGFADQGTYGCEVNNGIGDTQKHTVRLTVVSAPKFTTKPEPTMTVSEGDDVLIPCYVMGVKSAELSRTYNAKSLAENARVVNTENKEGAKSDLVIRNVQKSDNGYYGCRAVNDLGHEYTETLLHVI